MNIESNQELILKWNQRKKLLKQIGINMQRLSKIESELEDLLFDKLNVDEVEEFKKKVK